MGTSAIGWPPWLITIWHHWIRRNHVNALWLSMHNRKDDLICTTPRLCQNDMTPVALRGRGTTSAYNCFPATGLYFKSKVLASVGRGSTETTRLQHGSSMFGDTHAKEGGGGNLATSMATWLSSSLRNENGKLKIFVVRTTLLAKSHRC